ncbi:efflux RND transporter periplasmic adaptor subunit [Rhizorhabdus dicambivorans]|uniref:EmrA/EmrK family multidrug efflux transporter periplasmic adaptor subunit n=1 Tax=Rhizorhabdus dicambivorans TaxID=1850238 RepID=A0A2A4FYC1_9SPHN|nr:efflux RND transporter periplasmic adaptor subunit [Rhizorhabdus dicambivorans]ATE63041.1 EmrA/EmrK family multidrug efflux transporter periplasmic adaptor subunit [Rhizorhabdus dicambivorans]PCE43218.1 EmrA/EmrK family multidrug efflux transporter periplasmic adaptor subunit [Rhizorhabdus dicambivorans]
MNAITPIQAEDEAPAPPQGAPRARKRGLLLLGAAVLIGAASYGGHELLAPSSEVTDDAYVAGDVVAITAREPSTVLAINADNTEQVKRGQTLIEFDPATADAQMAAAEAELARAVRAVRSDFAKVDETGAATVQAETELARARNDLARRRAAAAEGAVSGEEVAHAADQVRTAAAALALARSRGAQAHAAVDGTRIETNPDVLAAIAAVRRAAISQGHNRLVAPVDGIVAQRGVQLGQQVGPGTPLMAVVPLDRLWIDANFRETQLADIRVGQKVEIETDIYGGGVTFHGKILGLGAGSGSAFALLPPQNASGNWIKIVQRVPVRIALDPAELKANPLRIGVSAKVTVDTSDHHGAPVARVAAPPLPRETSQDGGPAVQAKIDAIIAANRGTLR